MILRLHGVTVPHDAELPSAVERAVRARLGASARRLRGLRIARRSVDARQRDVKLVFAVDVDLEGDSNPKIEDAAAPPQRVPLSVRPGTAALGAPPVVVGAGPSGLFAALLLAEHGFRPLLIDRGGDVSERRTALRAFGESRRPDPECNALFGLGGAGAFSDGKLTTSTGHAWIREILGVLAECGAPQEILTDARPHVGTDLLPGVVSRLVARIVAAGGAVRTRLRADGFAVSDGRLAGLLTKEGRIDAEVAVLAIGHSARDTWAALAKCGVRLEPKPFQLGVRAEHPQAWVDARQLGTAAGHPALGAAEYKLAARPDGIPVFSFCMCPGGETMPTINEPDHLCLNGMSENARGSPFASSGLVVTLRPELYGGRDLESCLAFVRGVEARCFAAGGSDYSAPGQRLASFARGDAKRPGPLPATSYSLGATPALLDTVLPGLVVEPLRRAMPLFERSMPGYVHPDAVLLAPESRASSPVRIARDPRTRESGSLPGLFPVGEGAGYAGGIMSAALDGLRSAAAIIERFAPPRS
ncbi:MAG: NAD(P)-binding protein [Proteobacteria bacterium]|jgi:hypothetical protein|nr:NAD(P)-binding protein [Pseudomonadota bacterium]